MSEHTSKYQTIEHNGSPAFVLIPIEDFRKIQPLLDNSAVRNGIPHAVVKANMVEGKSLIRAWREYLGMTQEEVAKKSGMSQPAVTKLERMGAKPRKKTLGRIAAALGLSVEQIEE